MKQVTLKQIERLALEDEKNFERWQEWEANDFIRENANAIFLIETKKADRTFWGGFPKGWKSEMKTRAKERAKIALVEQYMKRHVMQLDGVYWLKDLTTIERMERA